jgi:hypothetical protein
VNISSTTIASIRYTYLRGVPHRVLRRVGVRHQWRHDTGRPQDPQGGRRKEPLLDRREEQLYIKHPVMPRDQLRPLSLWMVGGKAQGVVRPTEDYWTLIQMEQNRLERDRCLVVLR